jgi:hypothetical protein
MAAEERDEAPSEDFVQVLDRFQSRVGHYLLSRE